MSEEKGKPLQIAKGLRVMSIVFIAIFAIGVSMIIGDLVEIIELPVSSQAITTTIFGFFGFIICELNARRVDSWK